MIKLCKNLFYVPKYGNNQDSIILKRLFSTVTVVLVCLAAISFSAYAFFSYSVTSGSNTIKSSSFSASVTIKNSEDDLITQGKIQSYHFEAGNYDVTITTDSGTTGTGFCIVTVDGTKYYTQQLGKDITAPNQERKEVSFTLVVDIAVTVTFETRWGTNSYYNASNTENTFYITNTDSQQVIVANTTQSITDNTEETESEDTIPVETTPVETTPPTEPAEIVHIVQPGEALASIAEKYSTTYPILAAYNNMEDPRIIQPGQEIRIPSTDQVEASPEEIQ